MRYETIMIECKEVKYNEEVQPVISKRISEGWAVFNIWETGGPYSGFGHHPVKIITFVKNE